MHQSKKTLTPKPPLPPHPGRCPPIHCQSNPPVTIAHSLAGGNWGGLGAPQQHHQPLADPPSPDSTDPKISAFYNVTFTSSISRTVRTLDRRLDTRPQNQLSAAQEQHKGLCSILQGASVTFRTILLGVVGGTIYNNQWQEPLIRALELGLDSISKS
jgi:hypothetical protein